MVQHSVRRRSLQDRAGTLTCLLWTRCRLGSHLAPRWHCSSCLLDTGCRSCFQLQRRSPPRRLHQQRCSSGRIRIRSGRMCSLSCRGPILHQHCRSRLPSLCKSCRLGRASNSKILCWSCRSRQDMKRRRSSSPEQTRLQTLLSTVQSQRPSTRLLHRRSLRRSCRKNQLGSWCTRRPWYRRRKLKAQRKW